jgi:hypothetical protein
MFYPVQNRVKESTKKKSTFVVRPVFEEDSKTPVVRGFFPFEETKTWKVLEPCARRLTLCAHSNASRVKWAELTLILSLFRRGQVTSRVKHRVFLSMVQVCRNFQIKDESYLDRNADHDPELCTELLVKKNCKKTSK